MRRRETINVWPAIADLMTVLAVPALCVAVGRMPFTPGRFVDVAPGSMPKNEQMFYAIQQAEDFVQLVEKKSGLRLEKDQSLRFGDDLVGFALNGFEPQWRSDSRGRVERYCRAVARSLDEKPEMKDRFMIFVEGHADRTSCLDDPNCNWRISSQRAARFVALMRDSALCPGGAGWPLLPVGFADTRPIDGGRAAARRIALRLVPDYKKIIDSILKGSPGTGAAYPTH